MNFTFKPYIKKTKKKNPHTVVHTRNPSYLGGRDWKDHGSRLAQAKSSQDHILSNELGVVACTCELSCAGGIGWSITV
jgi:hypothetical protein